MIAFRATRKTLTVAVIGTTQTLAWGSSYYLPAILADPIAAGLGVEESLFFGLFSAALLLSAVLGPVIGRAIDRGGGREVLALSNFVLAAGLAWLGLARARFRLPAPGPCSGSAWRSGSTTRPSPP